MSATQRLDARHQRRILALMQIEVYQARTRGAPVPLVVIDPRSREACAPLLRDLLRSLGWSTESVRWGVPDPSGGATSPGIAIVTGAKPGASIDLPALALLAGDAAAKRAAWRILRPLARRLRGH